MDERAGPIAPGHREPQPPPGEPPPLEPQPPMPFPSPVPPGPEPGPEPPPEPAPQPPPEPGPLPSPVPPPQPPAPAPGPLGSTQLLTGGWGTAAIGAVTTIVVLGAIGEVMAFLIYAAGDQTRPSAIDFARLGGLFFYLFHHVGVVLEGGPALSGLSPVDFTGGMTIAAAALLGTFIGLWVMWRFGRSIGEEVGGSGWVRGINGAKIAVPYAVLTLALAFVVRIPRDALASSGLPGIHPSYVAAFLWPLGLAALAGFFGGFGSAGEHQWSASSLGRYGRGAIQGGARMMGFALLFAFIGLVVLAPTHPGDTADFFRPFQDKTARGVAATAGTALAAPNLAAGLILFPAMGTCLSAGGSLVGLGSSACVLSWTQFPGDRVDAQPGFDLPSPPVGYFLYLLVPLLAVLIGGRTAARMSGASTREQALGIGAMAGVVYGLLALLLAVLATVTFRAGSVSGLGGRSLEAHVGPELIPGGLWPFLWGTVGGAIGGLMEGRALRSLGQRATGLSGE
jgi:hypothetical protein